MGHHTKIPEHQAVYQRLRQSILLGGYAPGERLTIQGLTEQLGAGMTPVREAIRRLVAENALAMLGNRRVILPELGMGDIRDIYYLRQEIEPELARRATGAMSPPEIAALETLDQELNAAIATGDVDRYLAKNSAFHFRIYAAAGAPVLERMVQSLWVQIGPSLRVVCGRIGTSNLPDMHAEIVAALRAHDREAAARAMREDLQQGLESMLDSRQI